MSANASLRYGFELDRNYFFDFSMQFQFYTPIIGALTFHPVMQYLIIFESKTMKSDVRMLYILTHLALVLNEWSFCFAFRIYALDPFAGLYCEGPICRAGINKQILMTILAIPVILIVSPFIPLSCALHQMILPPDSKWMLSARTKITLFALLNLILFTNVVGFGVFGRDHDNSDALLEQEPELEWLTNRGGTIFLYGPPGDPQYFKWELLILLLSITLIAPFLLFFTIDSMRNIDQAASAKISIWPDPSDGAKDVSHCLESFFCYILPLTFMLAFMIIDVTMLPGEICAICRIILVTLFAINGTQFCFFFIIRNPTYVKILVRKFNYIIPSFCNVKVKNKKWITNSSIAPNILSAVS